MKTLATKTHRAEITKSKSKKKPFKVRWIAENGEVLAHCILSTRANCIKNILSMMNICNGYNVIVLDLSGRAAKAFDLDSLGNKEEVDVI